MASVVLLPMRRRTPKHENALFRQDAELPGAMMTLKDGLLLLLQILDQSELHLGTFHVLTKGERVRKRSFSQQCATFAAGAG